MPWRTGVAALVTFGVAALVAIVWSLGNRAFLALYADLIGLPVILAAAAGMAVAIADSVQLARRGHPWRVAALLLAALVAQATAIGVYSEAAGCIADYRHIKLDSSHGASQ